MKAIWLNLALNDLDAAISWIAEYDMDAAIRLDENVTELVQRLERFPYSGREGRVESTREAILGNYLLVYAINGDKIEILRFLHGAMRYP